jgi:hypothetical protein
VKRFGTNVNYYLPGIFLWLVGLCIFLSIYSQVFGTGVGPPFYFAYPVFLVLFILTIFISIGSQRRDAGAKRTREVK